LLEIIFNRLTLSGIASCAQVCKTWKALTETSALWPKFGENIGVTHYGVSFSKNDYKCAHTFYRLLEESYGEKFVQKIKQLPKWEDENDFNHIYEVGGLPSRLSENGKNHFGKKFASEELILIFHPARRIESLVVKFGFSLKDLEKKQFSCLVNRSMDLYGPTVTLMEVRLKLDRLFPDSWFRLERDLCKLLGIKVATAKLARADDPPRIIMFVDNDDDLFS
jgi:hypothetical protein